MKAHHAIVFDASNIEYKDKILKTVRDVLDSLCDSNVSLIGFNSVAFVLVDNKPSKDVDINFDDIIFGGMCVPSVGLSAAKCCTEIHFICGDCFESGKRLSTGIKTNTYCVMDKDVDMLTSLSFYSRGEYKRV